MGTRLFILLYVTVSIYCYRLLLLNSQSCTNVSLLMSSLLYSLSTYYIVPTVLYEYSRFSNLCLFSSSVRPSVCLYLSTDLNDLTTPIWISSLFSHPSFLDITDIIGWAALV
jgi:hypothetical protein